MSMPDSAMHSGIKASVRLWRKAEICPRPDWADNVIGGEILVVPEVMPRTWATDPALVRPRRSRLGYPGSGEIDMHVHLPKPLHGWRELLGEIGVIVIGVLIALGAEQTVEWLQWKSELAETREALNLELTHAMGSFQYRITLQGCINHRLDELSRWLAKSQPGDKLPLARAIGQPLGYAILTGTWETAKGGQVGRPPGACHFGSGCSTLISMPRLAVSPRSTRPTMISGGNLRSSTARSRWTMPTACSCAV